MSEPVPVAHTRASVRAKMLPEYIATWSSTCTLRCSVMSPPVERMVSEPTLPWPSELSPSAPSASSGSAWPTTPCTRMLSVETMRIVPPTAVSSVPPDTFGTSRSTSTPMRLSSVPPVTVIESCAATRPSIQTCERDRMETLEPTSAASTLPRSCTSPSARRSIAPSTPASASVQGAVASSKRPVASTRIELPRDMAKPSPLPSVPAWIDRRPVAARLPKAASSPSSTEPAVRMSRSERWPVHEKALPAGSSSCAPARMPPASTRLSARITMLLSSPEANSWPSAPTASRPPALRVRAAAASTTAPPVLPRTLPMAIESPASSDSFCPAAFTSSVVPWMAMSSAACTFTEPATSTLPWMSTSPALVMVTS